MGLLDRIFGTTKKKPQEKTYTTRNGKLVKADERYMSWISGDLKRMLEQLHKKGNPVDTHFLYLSIVEQTYKQRKDPKMRQLFKKVAAEHVLNFNSLADPLRRDMGGKLPQVPTFKYLSTVYTEDGELNRAIKVCEKAINFKLDDGTKSGFKGRIERIQKKMNK